jgi:hypothetical protein
MLKWMLKRLGHVLGVREELNRTKLRAHLLFEQLEDRTAPSAAVLRDVNVGPVGSAPLFSTANAGLPRSAPITRRASSLLPTMDRVALSCG